MPRRSGGPRPPYSPSYFVKILHDEEFTLNWVAFQAAFIAYSPKKRYVWFRKPYWRDLLSSAVGFVLDIKGWPLLSKHQHASLVRALKRWAADKFFEVADLLALGGDAVDGNDPPPPPAPTGVSELRVSAPEFVPPVVQPPVPQASSRRFPREGSPSAGGSSTPRDPPSRIGTLPRGGPSDPVRSSSTSSISRREPTWIAHFLVRSSCSDDEHNFYNTLPLQGISPAALRAVDIDPSRVQSFTGWICVHRHEHVTISWRTSGFFPSVQSGVFDLRR